MEIIVSPKKLTRKLAFKAANETTERFRLPFYLHLLADSMFLPLYTVTKILTLTTTFFNLRMLENNKKQLKSFFPRPDGTLCARYSIDYMVWLRVFNCRIKGRKNGREEEDARFVGYIFFIFFARISFTSRQGGEGSFW